MEKQYSTLSDFFKSISELALEEAEKNRKFFDSFFDSCYDKKDFSRGEKRRECSCGKGKEIPCYPGDIVYYFNKEKNIYLSLKVDSVTLTKTSTNIVCSKPLFNYISMGTAEKFTFSAEDDLNKTLFPSLDSVATYDSDLTLMSTKSDAVGPNDLINLSLRILLSKGTPVKGVVQISDKDNEQTILFNNFEDAYKKYSELKELLDNKAFVFPVY